MSPPIPIVDARELGRYDAATDTWLLRRASLSVAAGARIVVTGPSGSGKTLLLRALAWLDPLDEGELRWHGQTLSPSTVPSFRSHVIYLHQRPALIEGTVADNLRYPFTLALHGKRRFHEDRARSHLASLERSTEFLQKLSRDLSGGEAQITALLRAMQLEPEVLLLDEPTAALDPAATRAVEQCVNSMLVVGIVSLPGMMTGQLLSGTAPVHAVKYQIVIMFLIAAATALCTVAVVVLSFYRLFNTQHQFLAHRVSP